MLSICYILSGTPFHVTWNRVPDDMERGSRWYGTAVPNSRNTVRKLETFSNTHLMVSLLVIKGDTQHKRSRKEKRLAILQNSASH